MPAPGPGSAVGRSAPKEPEYQHKGGLSKVKRTLCTTAQCEMKHTPSQEEFNTGSNMLTEHGVSHTHSNVHQAW